MLLLAGSAAYGQVCARPAPGASVRGPAELRSANGKLEVHFALRTRVDVFGLTLYCYEDEHGNESPTLRVKPGDDINLYLNNELPAEPQPEHAHHHTATACGHGAMTESSTNLHFHGLTIPPVCHQDDVLHTIVQPGDEPFEYRIHIPDNQPPGLYWYHPHPHGFSEKQVLGGASGAMVVAGIEKSDPDVAGLPERVLVLRDQIIGGVPDDVVGNEGDEAPAPSLDASINYVPVMYPLYKPAVMLVKPSQKEFWRVVNASADTIYDVQLLYWPDADTQKEQPIRVIALDGVPVGKDYASSERKSILLPPGARAEFIMTTPPAGMHAAQLLTKRYDNGQGGDRDSYRVLANLRVYKDSPDAPGQMPRVGEPGAQTFSGLKNLTPNRKRLLYFSEKTTDPDHPKTSTSYFVTVDGAEPKAFDMAASKPNLTIEQGSVEDWIVENRAPESHVFHIHQLHFQVIERDGKPVNESALRDTIDLPFWDGKGDYPRVRLRMDFRDPNIVGTFLYHCHILEHEDKGMMGSIQVVPRSKH